MGDESNFEIKIRTDYDGTGAQAAKDDVTALGDASQTAGVSVGKMAESGAALEK